MLIHQIQNFLLDTLQGMAKISPKVSSVITERLSNRLDDSNTEDAIKDDLDLQPQAASLTAPVCYLPSVLRDRPQSSKAGAGRGVPPTVPPRSPRKLTEAAPVSTHRGGSTPGSFCSSRIDIFSFMLD